MMTSMLALLAALPVDARGAMNTNLRESPLVVHVRGPALEPEAESWKWLDARRSSGKTFKVPVTVWRNAMGDITHSAFGVWKTVAGSRLVQLQDSALGISLRDRLAMLCKDVTVPCLVWLGVRHGPIVGEPRKDALPTFTVVTVHDVVQPKEAQALFVEVARPPSCLAIRSLGVIHCARGPASCAKCKAAAAEPSSPALLDVCPDGDYTRPVIAVEREGVRQYRAYDVLRRFTSEAEARQFAASHQIMDVDFSKEP